MKHLHRIPAIVGNMCCSITWSLSKVLMVPLWTR
ncbi:unnamed protein product [Strongylus vulgaris]|uniref:Uncharacterized protein n=1 Tax=Strongylus vulgaris TaxID=40348 RepID=A0A3P7JAX2_STRVU|nr:unnamed protein product [Strongylus vulgaris]